MAVRNFRIKAWQKRGSRFCSIYEDEKELLTLKQFPIDSGLYQTEIWGVWELVKYLIGQQYVGKVVCFVRYAVGLYLPLWALWDLKGRSFEEIDVVRLKKYVRDIELEGRISNVRRWYYSANAFLIAKENNIELVLKNEEEIKVKRSSEKLTKKPEQMPEQIEKNQTVFLGRQLPDFNQKIFDRPHLRIPTREKRPLISGWTRDDYFQTQTIEQLLKQNKEYGIRTGIKLDPRDEMNLGLGDYYLSVIIFQKPTSQVNAWHDWIGIEETPFRNISYVDTEMTCHFYLLTKALPPNSKLHRFDKTKTIGIIFSEGRQVIGIDSQIGSHLYSLIKKEKDWVIYDDLAELEKDLKIQGIYAIPSLTSTTRPWTEIVNLKKPTPPPQIELVELNEQQKLVKRLVEEGKNIFITGSAGTGKSFTLKQIILALWKKHGKHRVGITSTTGMGATLIQGTTFHSYLGIGVSSEFEQDVILKQIIRLNRALSNWKSLKVLIIDEVSMLDGNLLDKLEAIARLIRKNDEPFGGIQLVLIGDFCQLPPVTKTVVNYAFESETWKKYIQQSVVLERVYRQKKEWFITYLQAIRFGRLSKKRWEDMLNWCGKEPNWPQDGITPTSLFSTNKEVQLVNEWELKKLSTVAYFYHAVDTEKESGKLKSFVKSLLAKETLELKVGAQVMMIWNWHAEGLVNGDKGVVVGFTHNKKENLPIVRFTNGKALVIGRARWNKLEGYNAKGDEIISASREQLPLILAWAITIDKSQGQSIERLIVDLKRCWRGGQVYTALSRATNPSYLKIVNFAYNRMRCEQKVKDFYDKLMGKEIKPRLEWKADSKQVYLQGKVREQWNKWLEAYEEKSKWPYNQITRWKNKHDQKHFDMLIKVIEKAISNSANLIVYRELITKLKKKNKQTKSKQADLD